MNCLFCAIDQSLVIEKYRHFTLIADPYPLCQSHWMVVSREHWGCIGELPLDCLEELCTIEATVRGHLGRAIAYEHGRAGTCHGNFCEHMHLHLLPLDVDLHLTLTPQFRDYPVQEFRDLRRYFHGMGEYLFFQNSSLEGRFYRAHLQKLPSHFLRTLIANAINRPELASWEQYALHLSR